MVSQKCQIITRGSKRKGQMQDKEHNRHKGTQPDKNNNNCAVCMWQRFHVNTDMRSAPHAFHKKQLVGYMHRIHVVANFYAITKFQSF